MDKTTIIVVEDNIVYCEFVCNMLAREGYRYWNIRFQFKGDISIAGIKHR